MTMVSVMRISKYLNIVIMRHRFGLMNVEEIGSLEYLALSLLLNSFVNRFILQKKKKASTEQQENSWGSTRILASVKIDRLCYVIKDWKCINS